MVLYKQIKLLHCSTQVKVFDRNIMLMCGDAGFILESLCDNSNIKDAFIKSIRLVYDKENRYIPFLEINIKPRKIRICDEGSIV